MNGVFIVAWLSFFADAAANAGGDAGADADGGVVAATKKPDGAVEIWKRTWTDITTTAGEAALTELYDLSFFSVTAKQNRADFLRARRDEAVNENPVELVWGAAGVYRVKSGADETIVFDVTVNGGKSKSARTVLLVARATADGVRIVEEERFDSKDAALTFHKRAGESAAAVWADVRKAAIGATLVAGDASLIVGPGRAHAITVPSEDSATTRWFVEGDAYRVAPWICVKRTPLYSVKRIQKRAVVRTGGDESALCGAKLGASEVAFFDNNVSPEPFKNDTAATAEGSPVASGWVEVFEEITGLTGVWALVPKKRKKFVDGDAIAVHGRKSESGRPTSFNAEAVILIGNPLWIDVAGGMDAVRLADCERVAGPSKKTRVFKCRGNDRTEHTVAWTPSKKLVEVDKKRYKPIF
ncbi:MAG: hypothetical protein HYY84_13810 [Deltaproteobacteria bacterium]|nr:hypothetical protein [Deltaproteobacteria bacterium]